MLNSFQKKKNPILRTPSNLIHTKLVLPVGVSPATREGRRGCAGKGDREHERDAERDERGAEVRDVQRFARVVLGGWCSALGDGGIERDGDRGFSALGGDGEDGGREGWGRDMRDGGEMDACSGLDKTEMATCGWGVR
ncbi:hypothetical protein AAC387_Pa08g0827 [Persea americana]